MNETSVGQVNLAVAVFVKNAAKIPCRTRQLKRNLKNSRYHIVQHALRRAGQVPQQITALGNNRLARDKREAQVLDNFHTATVMFFAAIKPRHDYTRIQ